MCVLLQIYANLDQLASDAPYYRQLGNAKKPTLRLLLTCRNVKWTRLWHCYTDATIYVLECVIDPNGLRISNDSSLS